MNVDELTYIQAKQVKSACDVIEILRLALRLIAKNPRTSDPVGDVRDALVEKLRHSPVGVRILLLFRKTWWSDTDKLDPHVDLDARFQDDAFATIAQAQDRSFSRRPQREPLILEPNEFLPFAAILVDNSPSAAGDLTSPRVLSDLVDEIGSLAGQFERTVQTDFLDSLESSIRRAERAGAEIAGVQIFDHAGGRVTFEPFVCDSEVHFATEVARRRTSGMCVKFRVPHRDRS